LKVYGAGEDSIAGADSRALARSLRNRGKIDPVFREDCLVFDIALTDVVKNDDVVAILGAGSIGRLVEELVAV
jgi:UDP-N-acetylmuramate--alanine ligase